MNIKLSYKDISCYLFKKDQTDKFLKAINSKLNFSIVHDMVAVKYILAS